MTFCSYRSILCLVILLALLCPPFAQPANADWPLAEYSLENNYGTAVAFEEFHDKSVVVLAFIGTECPLAKLYGPRLNDIQEEFADEGVVVLGISSNKQDSLTELSAYVHRHGIAFPVLKDVGNKLADEVGATRTPEVFVYDQERKLRYQGRIDDQYGVGYSKEKVSESDLAEAITQVLAGKEVATPTTKAIGCVIGRVKDIQPSGALTFTKHIAPILNKRCVECHREGEIGPFNLTSYEDVLGWEDTILEVIADNRMPPWNANPEHGSFANDARLNPEEVETLRTWVANGMPEGDPGDLPEPPKFTDGWKIPAPDDIFEMREEPFQVPAQGVVDYKRFVVDPGWTEDKYIYAAEARPQNRQVVHHILVYVILPGERRHSLRHVLVGYAPGSLPVHYEDGLALKVPAGSKLLFEMHYTPNGTKQTDLSYAGVCYIDEAKVKNLVRGQLAITNDFTIPPGDDNCEVEAYYRVRRDEQLLAMTPHMHLRGKSFRYEARFPDGSQEVLLDVPNYDFNWQLKYILEKPLELPRGTIVKCTAVYDNSEKNLVNPDPTRPVGWGDQSWDEMMIGFMDTVPVQ